MDKTIMIEKTSKRLKRWEFIATAALLLTFLAGFGTLYIAIPLGVTFFGASGVCFIAYMGVRIAIWWNHG